MDIANLARTTKAHSWYTEATILLSSLRIDIDHLLPYQLSLDSPTHLLPYRQDLNGHVRFKIYRQYISTTWIIPLDGLCPQMAFYSQHFLVIHDGIIDFPSYLIQCWSHDLRITLGSFRVGSH